MTDPLNKAIENMVYWQNRCEEAEARVGKAYRAGYRDSADMHSLDNENVPEEMEIGWQEFLQQQT